MGSIEINLLIAGAAGQGLVTIGQLLSKALVKSGYSILVTQSYQSRIRGGHNTYAIRTGIDEVLSPKESFDLIIALNEETVRLHEGELTPNGVIMTDKSIDTAGNNSLNVPFDQLAEKKFFNIVALGVAGAILGLNEALVDKAVLKLLAKKGDEVLEENLRVLSRAYSWAESQQLPLQKLNSVPDPKTFAMMNGNEAIALGALSAGVKLGAFYPMTPATSIMLTLAGLADKMGIVVEQAEDEISAINMALGASYAGVPSMTSTSGGGFALMIEGVSLAGMTETPIVIAIAQRPGPATGLPTRTEQGDLEMVLYAGHGEFPRAVFAPGSIEECFHLTRKSFELAEKYQGPAFILTDQFLADSYRAVAPFDVENLPQVTACVDPGSEDAPYKRYKITQSGVSPRLAPGVSEHLVVADSDEHDEIGHLTEDLDIRVKMVDKRMRKHDGMLSEVIAPEFNGDEDPDLVFVSWGSSRGAVLEAVGRLRAAGEKAASLHFSQLWPLDTDQFMDKLEAAKKVVGVESNFSGQFCRLIRRETGFNIKKQILRYDGLPLTSEGILKVLE